MHHQAKERRPLLSPSSPPSVLSFIPSRTLVVDHAERGIAEYRVVVLEEGEREEGGQEEMNEIFASIDNREGRRKMEWIRTYLTKCRVADAETPCVSEKEGGKEGKEGGISNAYNINLHPSLTEPTFSLPPSLPPSRLPCLTITIHLQPSRLRQLRIAPS